MASRSDGLEFKIDDKQAVERAKARLEKARKKIGDFGGPYARAAVFLDQWVQHNFKSEGGKVGGWAPFSPVTLRIIEGSDPGRMPAKLLQKTGQLRASFLPFATKRNAGIRSELPYARKHHEGEGRLPERRLLPYRREVIKDVRAIMRDHVKEAIGAKSA